MQLAEGASLSSGLVKEQLVGILGVKDTDAVDKLQKKGSITADQGLLAIQQAVLKQLGTQRLGEYATGSSGTLTGLLSNREEALDNLLKQFDNEQLPAMEAYKKALAKQVDALDASKESGKNVSLTLQSFADAALHLKTVWTEFTTGFVDKFTESYTKVLKELGIADSKWDKAGASAKEFGEILGNVGTLVGYAVQALEGLGEVLEWLENAVKGTIRLVQALARGDWAGARAAFDRDPNEAEDKRRKKEREQLEDDFAKGGEGTQKGGGASALRDFLSPQLSDLRDSKKKSSSGSGKGSSGGGTFGAAGSFQPDFSGLEGGVSLPFVTLPEGPGPVSLFRSQYQAQRDELAASIKAQTERDLNVQQTIENVEIVIEGSDLDPKEIGEAVAGYLRQLGRYVRTPAPTRT